LAVEQWVVVDIDSSSTRRLDSRRESRNKIETAPGDEAGAETKGPMVLQAKIGRGQVLKTCLLI